MCQKILLAVSIFFLSGSFASASSETKTSWPEKRPLEKKFGKLRGSRHTPSYRQRNHRFI